MSERPEAEDRQPGSHPLLEAVFESTHVLLAVLDADLNFIRVNSAYASADDRAPEFFVGKNHFSLYPNPENEAIFRRAVASGERVQVSAKPFEYAHAPERGVTHWDWTLTPIRDGQGRVRYLVLSLLNVTDRIKALEQLGTLNEQLEARVEARTHELLAEHKFIETVLNTIGALVVVLDRDGRIVRFNHACEQVTGHTAAEALGRCVWDFLLVPEQRDPVRGVFHTLRGGRFPNTYENYWLTKAGERRLIAWSNTALTDAQGEVTYVIATGIDVTEARQTQDSLVRSEQLFREMAENLREVLFVRDTAQDRIIYTSPAYEALWGQPRELLYADPLAFLRAVHAEDRPRVVQGMLRQRETGEAFDQEYRIVRPDGESRWVWARTFPIRNGRGEVYRIAGLIEDVTERKASEAQRLAAAKAQRDTLVREVHHRIKNNLQGVVGLLSNRVAAHPELRALLEGAITQVNTMGVVHGLQGQSTGELLRLCDLSEAIARSVVGLTGVPVEPMVMRQTVAPITLASEESVPVALVLNELIFNAVKHRDPAATEPVRVVIDREDSAVRVRVINRARALPAGLDFGAGRGLGVGLTLVKALLPPQGATLALHASADEFQAELRLAAPVVVLGEGSSDHGPG